MLLYSRYSLVPERLRRLTFFTVSVSRASEFDPNQAKNSVDWSKMALAALFGRRKSPEEMLKQNQRALNKVGVLERLCNLSNTVL